MGKKNSKSSNTVGAERSESYEEQLTRLQVELAYLQSWVVTSGARIVVVFE
jgi:polyphosphate kinase 2 (PPK2 family)